MRSYKTCQECELFVIEYTGSRGGLYGACPLRDIAFGFGIGYRSGSSKACKEIEPIKEKEGKP